MLRAMAGAMRRFKVRYSDGTLRTVTARSHKGAKKIFIARYQPPRGECLVIWPQGDTDNKKNMRT